MPNPRRKRPSQAAKLKNRAATDASQTPINVDYTSYLRPAKEWLATAVQASAWVIKRNKEGIPNAVAGARRLGLRQNDLNDKETVELWIDRLTQVYLNEQRITLYLNPSLPYPERGALSNGYSWIAWSYAAEAAGAKRPTSTISEVSWIIHSGLDYAASTVWDWRSNYGLFAEHINVLLVARRRLFPYDSATTGDAAYVREREADLIAYRVCDMVGQVFFWSEVTKSLFRLAVMGIANSGRSALKQMIASNQPREEFIHLDRLCWHGRRTAKVILQSAFLLYINPSIVKSKTIKGKMFLGGDSYETVDTLELYLTETPEEIHKRSYLEYTIAGLAGFFDNLGGDTTSLRDFARYSFEYEQALIKDPELAHRVHPYIQALIGETAVLIDLHQAIQSIKYASRVRRDFWISLNADLRSFHNETYLRHEFRGRLFARIFLNQGGKPVYLPEDGQFDSEVAERFWRHWDEEAKSILGADLDNTFGLRHYSQPRQPFWFHAEPDDGTSDPNANDTERVDPQQSLSRSGHSYLRDEIQPRLVEKIKTRGLSFSSDSVQDGDGGKEQSQKEADVKPEPTSTTTDHPIFSVSNKQYKLVKRLFSTSGSDESQGQVRWDNIYKLMRAVGFTIEEVGGSVVRFVPPNKAGIPFNDHRPHPEVSIGSVRYRAFGQRLKQRYGWTIEWFRRSSQSNRINGDGQEA
ncbi:hypothetical protein IAT40_002449 [Kwoniella sp. CBS 6097]